MNAFTKGRKQALNDGKRVGYTDKRTFFYDACEQSGEAYRTNKAQYAYVNGYMSAWGDTPTAPMKAIKR